MAEHLIDGEFQSDKYPTTPRGKVPLSCKDMMAQDLLWEYAQRRRKIDADFSADLEAALRAQGYVPLDEPVPALDAKHQQVSDQCRAVAHIAKTISEVHGDLAKTYAHHGPEAHMDFVGRLTAERMEVLGDMANGMDIVQPEDEWLNPIFEGVPALPMDPAMTGRFDAKTAFAALSPDEQRSIGEAGLLLAYCIDRKEFLDPPGRAKPVPRTDLYRAFETAESEAYELLLDAARACELPEFDASPPAPPGLAIFGIAQCAVCGCTEAHACPEGCGWATEARDLCTRCAAAAH